MEKRWIVGTCTECGQDIIAGKTNYYHYPVLKKLLCEDCNHEKWGEIKEQIKEMKNGYNKNK